MYEVSQYVPNDKVHLLQQRGGGGELPTPWPDYTTALGYPR